MFLPFFFLISFLPSIFYPSNSLSTHLSIHIYRERAEQAAADENRRRQEADKRRKHLEHLDEIAERTYRRRQREEKRVNRANDLAKHRGRVVGKRVEDLYYFGKLNAERRKREDAEARWKAEKDRRHAEAARKKAEEDEEARQARLKNEREADEDAATLR